MAFPEQETVVTEEEICTLFLFRKLSGSAITPLREALSLPCTFKFRKYPSKYYKYPSSAEATCTLVLESRTCVRIADAGSRLINLLSPRSCIILAQIFAL